MTEQETNTPQPPQFQQQPPYQPIIINQQSSNGIGTAGFVISLVTLLLGWIPVFGWVLWVIGLILSAVGMTKKPRGLAIAGLVISLIGIVFLLVIFGAIVSAVGLATTATSTI